ncbi:hypothetical protein, partial [Paraburkholderia youngii]|uniref:hypothetical protein n=1 Tax=Paraburkholderia youngii TaxID=2782701 RepID=UPI001C376A5F
VLCGAGHNLRMILRKLRLFYALFWSLCATARSLPSSRHDGRARETDYSGSTICRESNIIVR